MDKAKSASAKKDAPGQKTGAPPNRRKGAPVGNKNAKGNRGGAAPLRNHNAEKHGAYSTFYADALDEDERAMMQDMPTGEHLMALAVIEAQKTIAEQEQAIRRMQTKEVFADTVSSLLLCS